MTDPTPELVDAEAAVADALDTGIETPAVAVPPMTTVAPPVSDEDPWFRKSTFFTTLAMDHAVEVIGYAKRLLVLAEASAVAVEDPAKKAELLLQLSDRWRNLTNL